MEKQEILKASRSENQNKDFPELELSKRAGAIAMQVGALVCALLVILAAAFRGKILYSPWVIYFSILGTNWLVRFVGRKRASDLVGAILFFALMVLAGVFFVLHLTGGSI